MIIDGKKYACQKCIRGHRVTTCTHSDAEMVLIKPKGRPSTTCEHCKAVRMNKNFNPMGRCVCGKNLKPAKNRRRRQSKASISSVSTSASLITPRSSGFHDCDCGSTSICKCNVTKRKPSVVSLSNANLSGLNNHAGSDFISPSLNRKSFSSYVTSPNILHSDNSFTALLSLTPNGALSPNDHNVSLDFSDHLSGVNDESSISLMNFILNSESNNDKKPNNYTNTTPVSPTATSYIDNVIGADMNVLSPISNNSSFIFNDGMSAVTHIADQQRKVQTATKDLDFDQFANLEYNFSEFNNIQQGNNGISSSKNRSNNNNSNNNNNNNGTNINLNDINSSFVDLLKLNGKEKNNDTMVSPEQNITLENLPTSLNNNENNSSVNLNDDQLNLNEFDFLKSNINWNIPNI